MSTEIASPKRSNESSSTGTSPVTTKKAKTTKSPHEEYLASQKEFLNEHIHIKGKILIRGIAREDDSDEDSEEEVDKASYTKEEMESLRFVMLTEERIQALEEMQEFVLGDTDGCFSTSYSYLVYGAFSELKERLSGMRNWKAKFNLLFGFTHTIHENDVWMHDNEGDMNDMVIALAKLWKAMLRKTSDDLGIDQQYTRPGVIALLEKFKKDIEASYAEPKFKFDFT